MEALLQSATVKYKHGLYSEALADLNTFLGSGPNAEKRALALGWRAAVYKRLGKLNLAVVDFNEAIEESDAPNLFLLINRGIALAEMGRFNESLFDMNLAVQADLNGIAGLIGRSFTYYRMGNYNSSANDLVQAINKNPNDARLRFKCAQVLNRAQRFDEAIALFESTKRLNGSDPKIFVGLAVVRKSQKLFGEAVKQATIAIEMDNNLTSAMIIRAVASLNLGNLSDAVKDTERVLELASIESADAAVAVMVRASIFCLVGDYEAAIANCSKAIEIWQEIGHFWFLRGAARCRQLSSMKQGLKDLQMAAKLEPKLTKACELLQSLAMRIPVSVRSVNPVEPPRIQLAIEDKASSLSRRSSLSELFEVNRGYAGDDNSNPYQSPAIPPLVQEKNSTEDTSNSSRNDLNSTDPASLAAAMSVEDVCKTVTEMNWPENLKNEFLKTVKEQKIDGRLLLSLEDADLLELGITSAFQRRRIMLEIKRMREPLGQ